MNTTIVSSLISAFAALAVCLVNNHFVHVQQEKLHAENIALVSYRLEQLEKKVDLHNQVIDRTYALERRADVLEEKIKVENHRIDDLEKGENK